MTPELPTGLARSLVLTMEVMGADARSVLQRLGRGAKAKSGWEEVCTALETYFSVEGVAATQRLIQTLATRSSVVLQAAELLGDVHQTYAALLEAASAQDVVVVEVRNTPQGLTVSLELRRGHRASMVFFQACVWLLTSLPRVRGLPDSRVLVERVSERGLHCVVVPPADRAVRLAHQDGPLRQLARQALRFDGVTSARASLTPQSLQERFGLTRAEARVVRRLAEGRSIKRIAEELKVSPETARTHAKRAMQKTDTHRQAELVSLVLSE
ncbi:MAG: helix-turn-helix transcriptional regulator [Archangium sp.]|nr:helix-turn-helix transcriptional regulator [Archangium sp.]